MNPVRIICIAALALSLPSIAMAQAAAPHVHAAPAVTSSQPQHDPAVAHPTPQAANVAASDERCACCEHMREMMMQMMQMMQHQGQSAMPGMQHDAPPSQPQAHQHGSDQPQPH
jgi:hypothetical protein